MPFVALQWISLSYGSFQIDFSYASYVMLNLMEKRGIRTIQIPKVQINTAMPAWTNYCKYFVPQ